MNVQRRLPIDPKRLPQIRVYCFEHAKFSESLKFNGFIWVVEKNYYGLAFETQRQLTRYMSKKKVLLNNIQGELDTDPWYTFQR